MGRHQAKWLSVVLAMACSFGATYRASAAEDKIENPFYLGVEAGAALFGDLSLSNGKSALVDVIKVRADGGWALAGTVGYRFTETFHVALDVGYSSSSIGGVYERTIQPRIACVVNGTSGACPAPTISGKLSTVSALARTHYDIPFGQRWTISGAAAAGLASVGLRVTTEPATVLPKATALLDSQNTRLVVSAGLDALYALSPRLSLVVGYRYLSMGTPHFSAVVGNGPFTVAGTLSSNLIRLGIRTPL